MIKKKKKHLIFIDKIYLGWCANARNRSYRNNELQVWGNYLTKR